MARKWKLWLGVASLIVFLLAAWFLIGRRWNRPVQQASLPPESGQSAAEVLQGERPVPAYVPLGESQLHASEAVPEYRLSGKVTSEMGEPLPGAVVSIYGTPPRWSPPSFEQPAALATQTCGEQGQYEIRLKVPANLWVTIRKDGFAASNAFLPVRDLKLAVRDFSLPVAESSISGFVLDKQDAPVAGALVAANIPPSGPMADNQFPAPIARVTDAAGKYTLEGLPDGDVGIVASARGFSQREEQTSLRAGQPQLLNISLSPASTISFPVRNSRGEPLPYATATAPGFFKIAGGDKRGLIEFAVSQEISPFECTVAAVNHKAATILLDPKAPPSSVVLEEMPVFRGRVLTEAGKAADGVQVVVIGKGGVQGKFDGAAETDKNGRFSLFQAYPPAQEVRASKTGYFDQRREFDVSKPAPQEVVLRLKSVEAGIFGRVVDYKGLPVKRFIVHLRVGAGGQDYQRSFADDSGRFLITDVAPGTYTLIIQSALAATTDNVQLFNQEGVEIRKGFLFGEFLAQFPKPQFTK